MSASLSLRDREVARSIAAGLSRLVQACGIVAGDPDAPPGMRLRVEVDLQDAAAAVRMHEHLTSPSGIYRSKLKALRVIVSADGSRIAFQYDAPGVAA